MTPAFDGVWAGVNESTRTEIRTSSDNFWYTKRSRSPVADAPMPLAESSNWLSLKTDEPSGTGVPISCAIQGDGSGVAVWAAPPLDPQPATMMKPNATYTRRRPAMLGIPSMRLSATFLVLARSQPASSFHDPEGPRCMPVIACSLKHRPPPRRESLRRTLVREYTRCVSLHERVGLRGGFRGRFADACACGM
jgi:hypothetical protein